MSAQLLAWKYIVLNLATCNLGCHGYQRVLGNDEHKGWAKTQSSASPPISPQLVTVFDMPRVPGGPHTAASTHTQANKAPPCFPCVITTGTYWAQWGSPFCGLFNSPQTGHAICYYHSHFTGEATETPLSSRTCSRVAQLAEQSGPGRVCGQPSLARASLHKSQQTATLGICRHRAPKGA